MKFLRCFVLKFNKEAKSRKYQGVFENSIDRFSTLIENQIIHMISNHFGVLLDIFRLHQPNIDSISGLNKTI